MLESLKGAETAKYVQTVTASSKEEIIRMLKKGEADYGLVVPADFSKQLSAGKSTAWELLPGKSFVKNLTAETVLRRVTDQANSLQALGLVLGPQASQQALVSGQGDKGKAVSFVEAGRLSKSGKESTAMQYYSAAELVMFLLFGGMSAAAGIAIDRENRTLERMYSTPVPGTSVLFGKLLGRGIISVAQALIIIGFTWGVYGVDWGGNLGSIMLVCLLTIIAAMSLALLLALLISSSRTVQSVYTIIIFVMTFVSGGMSPYVGEFLSKVGRGTVSYWAANSINRLMLGYGGADTTQGVGILACFSLGLMLAALIGYRKVGYHE
jgi:ABC-2 type transport system permease protein